MLDINFIRDNKAQVEKAIKDKNMSVDLDKLLELDKKRKDLLMQIEILRSDRKKLAKDRTDIEKARSVKKMLQDLEPQLTELNEQFVELSLHVPNIPSLDAPIGKDESENKVVSTHGEPTKFDFKPKTHIELGLELDIIDLERGVKVSGFRGYYLKNQGAILHMALMAYAFRKMVEKKFVPMIVPTLVGKSALIGSGHFPFGQDEIYKIANPGKLATGEVVKNETYLVGTAEPSLLAYRENETIDESELPLRYCGYSQCYRSEVGSYGKDLKGLYRVHEFQKIEQVIICKNDYKEADEWFEHLRENSEEILHDLGLPYRVLEICTGDMGAGKYRMYDLETWMPSLDKYGETHSNSNLTDWQTRRLNIKVKTKDGKKYYPFALNNTALASPRILIALLENCQQKDGSIKIPEVLVPYTGFNKINK